MGRYLHDIVIAIESIAANQMRSLLTALGIIFGVAAVITMLAIGRGAQQENPRANKNGGCEQHHNLTYC